MLFAIGRIGVGLRDRAGERTDTSYKGHLLPGQAAPEQRRRRQWLVHLNAHECFSSVLNWRRPVGAHLPKGVCEIRGHANTDRAEL